jgi:methionine transaminase
LKEKDLYLELGKFYQEKRDLFRKLLKGSRFILKPVFGSYFQLVDYSKISDEKDVDYAVRLTAEHGVAPIPMSVFYHKNIDNHYLRFCFAKENETLERAAEKLIKV